MQISSSADRSPAVIPNDTPASGKAEAPQSVKKSSLPLSYRLRNNAEAALSGTVTAMGAATVFATGNPTGMYPVYSRLMAWDSPKVISAADKLSTGVEDGKRAFNIAPSLAHLGFVFSFLLSPFLNKALREDVFPHNTSHDVRALRIVAPAVGIVTGVAGAAAGRLIERSLSEDNQQDRKSALKKSVNAEITGAYNQLFEKFKEKADKGKLKDKDFQQFCAELLDEKNIEKMIYQATDKVEKSETPALKGKRTSEKKRLGLPRLNLQNFISTGLAASFVAFAELSESTDGRKTGNTLMEMATMQRLVGFSLYKMLYEPIFVKKDRSLSKDFKVLDSNQIRADMIAIGTLGVSDRMFDYAKDHNMMPNNRLNLEGHAMYASVAAAIGGFIEFFAMPRLVNLLDSDEKKIAASRKYLGNAVAEKLASVKDLDKKSPAEIQAEIFSEENKALYIKSIERGLKQRAKNEKPDRKNAMSGG